MHTNYISTSQDFKYYINKMINKFVQDFSLGIYTK